MGVNDRKGTTCAEHPSDIGRGYERLSTAGTTKNDEENVEAQRINPVKRVTYPATPGGVVFLRLNGHTDDHFGVLLQAETSLECLQVFLVSLVLHSVIRPSECSLQNLDCLLIVFPLFRTP